MAKLTSPPAKRNADTMPSPERTAAPSSMYGGKAGSGMARKNVPATSAGMRPSTRSSASSYSSPIGVFRPVNSGAFGKVLTAVRLMMRAGATVHKPISGEPHGQRPHLDARARRGVRRAGGIVEGDVRHAVRAARVAVMGLEDERLLAVHVGEPMPSMPGSVREHEALERPFRLARRIEHGIGRDEVGGCGAVREGSGGGIAHVDVRKARGAGIVEETRVRRALAETHDAGTVDQHEIGARERRDELDDLREVSGLDRRTVGEIRDSAAVQDEREAGAIEIGRASCRERV